VRRALGTLPWVEHDSIQADTDKREVRFNLKDSKSFNEQDLRDALKNEGFKEMTVTARPN
jgi:hypothetical protein